MIVEIRNAPNPYEWCRTLGDNTPYVSKAVVERRGCKPNFLIKGCAWGTISFSPDISSQVGCSPLPNLKLLLTELYKEQD